MESVYVKIINKVRWYFARLTWVTHSKACAIILFVSRYIVSALLYRVHKQNETNECKKCRGQVSTAQLLRANRNVDAKHLL